MALEGLAGRGGFVAEGPLGNHAAGKFAGQRVRGEKPLGGVGQRFAGAIDSTAIGRDEPIAAGEAGGGGETRYARRCDKTGGDELAA